LGNILALRKSGDFGIDFGSFLALFLRALFFHFYFFSGKKLVRFCPDFCSLFGRFGSIELHF